VAQGDIVTVFGHKIPVHAISGVETRGLKSGLTWNVKDPSTKNGPVNSVWKETLFAS